MKDKLKDLSLSVQRRALNQGGKCGLGECAKSLETKLGVAKKLKIGTREQRNFWN